MTDNWVARWEDNNIPFHLENVNPLLEKYWPKLCITPPANVLVPLCGKTRDLIWLAEQGLQITGVELSDIACKAFFTENNLKYDTQLMAGFTRYFADKIEIYCGDLFALPVNKLSKITAVYDRAALIALPKQLRSQYALHITRLMAPASRMLLIVLETRDEVQGPPYPVDTQEIQQLFGKSFQIMEIERVRKANLSQHLKDQGYKEVDEVVYILKRYE